MAINADHIRVYLKGGFYVSFANDPKIEEQLNHLIAEEIPEFQGNDYFGELITIDAESVIMISRRLVANVSARTTAGAASLDVV